MLYKKMETKNNQQNKKQNNSGNKPMKTTSKDKNNYTLYSPDKNNNEKNEDNKIIGNNKNNDNDKNKKTKQRKNRKIKTEKVDNLKITHSHDKDIMFFGRPRYSRKKESNDHISQSLNKLKEGDDESILNELVSLCDFLCLSSDRIGFDSKMGNLLEEICKNLSKTYMPQIVIYSLQCINHILDINPYLSRNLNKINGVSSIMKVISTLEDITCIDYTIKVFEKISNGNSRMLLENNVYEKLLGSIYDFTNIHQKKTIMKICHNITLRGMSNNEYNNYIKSSMSILMNIIKIDDNDNNDHLIIVEKATEILYNIINNLKYGDILYLGKDIKEEKTIDELINKYNIIEKYIDILDKYFIKENQIITDTLIRVILRTIILILEISGKGMDKLLSNNLLVIIADIINNGFNSEKKSTNTNNINIINNNDNNFINENNNENKNIHIFKRRLSIFLFELFNILIALFPDWKNKYGNNKKILSVENSKYFDYFCQNIFLPLIKNIIDKSNNKIIEFLTKLILAFINNVNEKDIILYLPSKEISQIINKLLDLKNNSSIIKAFSLIESLLKKSPENYIVSFIREGVLHKLKNFKIEIKNVEPINDIISYNIMERDYFPHSPILKDDDNKFKEQIKEKNEFKLHFLDIDKKDKDNDVIDYNKHDNKKFDFIKFNDILDKEKNKNEKEVPQINILKNIKTNINSQDNIRFNNDPLFIEENEDELNLDENEEEIREEDDIDVIEEELEKEEENEINSPIFLHNSFEKEKEKDNNDEVIEIDNKSIKENESEEKVKYIKNISIKDPIQKIEESNIFEKDKDKDNEKSNEEKNKLDLFKKNRFINLENNQKNVIRRRRYIHNMDYNYLDDNISSLEMETIQLKKKNLLEKFLSDEKISLYLSKTENKTKDSLFKIQNTLSNYQQLLSSTSEENKNKEQYIKEIIDILIDENISITSFELENSKILLSLCNYFDERFKEIYDKLIDDEEYNSIDKLINDLSDEKIKSEKIEYNNNIIEKIRNFFKIFIEENNTNKITNFIKLLNGSIQDYNSPIYSLIDNNKRFMNNIYINRNRETSIKIKYNDQIFKDDVLNTNLIIDNIYKNKLCELNTYFITNRSIYLSINENTSFKEMKHTILSKTNISLIANDKYDLYFKFYIDNNTINNNKFFDMDIEEDILDNEILESPKNNFTYDNIIDENWTYKQLLDNYSKKYKIQFPSISFGLSIKVKNESLANELRDNNNSNNFYLEHYSPFIKEVNMKDYINFDKYSFMMDYYNDILFNKGIYFSKRLMPSLYLISLLNLILNKYDNLFNIQKLIELFRQIKKKEFKKLFYNSKIEQLINKISTDQYNISNTSLSTLCNYISNHNQFSSKFPIRLLSFKTSFSPKYKSMINLQNFLRHYNPNQNSKYSVTLKRSMRLKINVNRDNILETGFNILKDEYTSKFQGFLEFEYNGEIGNGLGPTLEFYTLIIDKIKENKNLWYKNTNGSLYPTLLSDKENNDEILKLFKLLGYIIGRAIYDDRLLDIPLSSTFWKLILDTIISKDIGMIDVDLYKTISDLVNLINKKKEYIKNNKIENCETINFDDIILYNNCKLSELDIYFTFPGYNNIELKPNGEDILLTMNNIEEYVNLIYDYLFYKGVDKIVKAFKEGFNMNFDINKLKYFTVYEIEEHICGNFDLKWEKNILYENLKPEHGYTNQSRIFNDLITFMSKLDKNERKKFLTFATGCSRLPIGGFKALTPKLTVVKKYCEEEDDPDDFLPTVMTCQNYLKIPEYSSYNILQKRLLFAMNEGCNEFNLS